MNLINIYCHWKIELIGQPLGKKKISQPQKRILWGEVPKNWKKDIFPFMTTFDNFILKIETSWAKEVVKSISETWNANDVIVFVYSRIKRY